MINVFDLLWNRNKGRVDTKTILIFVSLVVGLISAATIYALSSGVLSSAAGATCGQMEKVVAGLPDPLASMFASMGLSCSLEDGVGSNEGGSSGKESVEGAESIGKISSARPYMDYSYGNEFLVEVEFKRTSKGGYDIGAFLLNANGEELDEEPDLNWLDFPEGKRQHTFELGVGVRDKEDVKAEVGGCQVTVEIREQNEGAIDSKTLNLDKFPGCS
ncbi:MAG: hypothetical protein SVV03_02190 [Candidatus Nanohaloarchaea archaeon]|nr:hypothetical protein [Candidatus Nanohaloarchaea archaeon]